MRTLAVIACAGLAVSVVSLAVAAAIGGDDVRDIHIGGWHGFFHRCESSPETQSIGTTRELPWDGDAEVRINVPATIRYRPDAGANLVATGSPVALSHLRLRNGRIDFDCSGFEPGESLELVLPGRALNQFTLNGTGHLVLENINQRRLEIKLNGHGDVRGTGTAEDVDLRIAGSGDAYLGGLAIQRVRVRIAGSGDAELAPEDNADIRIAGSGRIRFLKQPRNLQTRIAGSGRIVNASPAATSEIPPAP